MVKTKTLIPAASNHLRFAQQTRIADGATEAHDKKLFPVIGVCEEEVGCLVPVRLLPENLHIVERYKGAGCGCAVVVPDISVGGFAVD